jgi:hypothetical protein
MSEATPKATIIADEPADNGVESAADKLAESIATAATGWNGDIPKYGIDDTAREMLSNAESSIVQAAAYNRASAQEALSYEQNLDLHPDGRTARAAQARAEGRSKTDEALTNAATMMDIGEDMLIQDSAPPLGESKTERNINITQAKHDIRMTVESDADPASLVERLKTLASLDSTVSTVLTNDPQFFDLLLASRGIDAETRGHYKTLVQSAAVAARAARGNRSAQLAQRVGFLRGAAGGARSLTQR